jgi:NADPH:quinone reductase-like Zn-dependent oxidoreductase
LDRLEYDLYGGPEVVQLRPYTLPPPGKDELLVRVAASSINPADWKIRSGTMRIVTGARFPRAMGTDFSGTVEAVGPGVTKFAVGDAVVGSTSLKTSGAFAGQLITTQSLVVKKPVSLSFAAASTLPVAGVTAWFALVKYGHLVSGQRLFINGALGAVGQAAISIAREVGAEVVGRVGPLSFDKTLSLGCSTALDYKLPIPGDFDHSCDIVFDCNGSLSAKEEARLIKRGGKIFDINPTPEKILLALVFPSRKVIFADLKAEYLQPVVDLAAAGKLVIPICQTTLLPGAPALLASLEQGKRLDGKAVIIF